jgi:P27 family predicted phage terminase small subunit
MGLRGKQPTPTPILAARGSWVAKVRQKSGEPTPDIEAPDCPDWLDDRAKEVWFQLVPMLVSMRVLTRIDAGALARYCDAFVQWKRAAEFLNSHELIYQLKDKDGSLRGLAPYPQNGLYEKFGRILSALEIAFGLTPSARTRIAATKAGQTEIDKSKLLKLLPHRAG